MIISEKKSRTQPVFYQKNPLRMFFIVIVSVNCLYCSVADYLIQKNPTEGSVLLISNRILKIFIDNFTHAVSASLCWICVLILLRGGAEELDGTERRDGRGGVLGTTHRAERGEGTKRIINNESGFEFIPQADEESFNNNDVWLRSDENRGLRDSRTYVALKVNSNYKDFRHEENENIPLNIPQNIPHSNNVNNVFIVFNQEIKIKAKKMISFSIKNVLEIFSALVIGSMLDLDHFIAAKSFSLFSATHLQNRPFGHNLFFIFILSLIIFLFFSKRFSLLFFTATFNHLSRDALRRGYTLTPFSPLSTPNISYFIYLSTFATVPFLIAHFLNKFSSFFTSYSLLTLSFSYPFISLFSPSLLTNN